MTVIWCMVPQIEYNNFFVILDCFLPFYPSNNTKNHNFEKWKKILEISSFYIFVSKITIIWYMVPEIRSETERIFLSFWVIYCLFTTPNDPENQNFEKMPKNIIFLHIHVYHKWRSYDTWLMNYKVRQTEIFVILGHFLPF